MRFSQVFLALAAVSSCSLAMTIQPSRIGKRQTCSTPDGSGTCQAASSCSGYTVSGYCPGDSGEECCLVTSCPPGRNDGVCKNATQDLAIDRGFYVASFSEYCPGPTEIQCYIAAASVAPSPTPTPTGTGIAAFDISSTQTSAFWTCAKKTYDKAVIRGYLQGCGSGGLVDSGLSKSFTAAKAAGFTNFDAYMFPCAGTPKSGCNQPACKSASQQVSEFEAAVQASGMTPGHVWLDLEPTTASSCAACNAWNLGTTGNINLAKEFIAAIQGSSYNWGIYANGNQWSQMFGSRSYNLASSLPLWAVQDDGKPGVGTVTTFMGGWTSAYAKQYSENDNVCGGSKNADLDSFTG